MNTAPTTSTTISSVVLEVTDVAAAETFYSDAFGLDDAVRFRASETPTGGFRGFTMSLVVSQPSTVDSLVATALAGGATTLKAPKKSFWGYGGVVQAPDGTIWQIATSAKKDSGPATRAVDDVVLLLGVDDVKATKQFYVERGLSVSKSFGGKYVEFDPAGSQVNLGLYTRKFAAKNAGVSAEGSGSHRLVVVSDADPFVDPDGFVWERRRD